MEDFYKPEILKALESYRGMMVVVKYGGAAMQSDGLKRSVAQDAFRLAAAGAKVALVHGGGPELSAMQGRLGIETKFVDGLRYTDGETMDAALMTLCGKLNKDLVRLLENEGARAAGISGIDGGLLRCERQKSPDLGFVGEIRAVDTGLLETLLGAGYIPVVSTVGLGTDGEAFNINADTAAGRIAASLFADRFITLSDIPGVLRDMNDPSSLIREIRTEEAERYIEAGVISGGMIPKIRGLTDAVLRGARAASIIDGRVPHALALALCSNAGTESGAPEGAACRISGTTVTL